MSIRALILRDDKTKQPMQLIADIDDNTIVHDVYFDSRVEGYRLSESRLKSRAAFIERKLAEKEKKLITKLDKLICP